MNDFAINIWREAKNMQELQCLRVAMEAEAAGLMELRDYCLSTAAEYREEERHPWGTYNLQEWWGGNTRETP